MGKTVPYMKVKLSPKLTPTYSSIYFKITFYEIIISKQNLLTQEKK